MNKNIRLLVEGFFDDEIFNVEDDIKSDIEDIGRYYDYNVGDIFYQNKKPYAICCGNNFLFKDNKPRFCLLNVSDKPLKWRVENKLVKELDCFKFKYFDIKSFNDFLHIDENGYENTLIIKNNYNINEFPVFKYCINQGNNVYLPAIDELLILFLNKNKIKDTLLCKYTIYWSSTLRSIFNAYSISIRYCYISNLYKYNIFYVCPFFRLY